MSEFTLIIKSGKKPKSKMIKVNVTRLSYSTGYSKSHISRIFSLKTVPSVGCLVKMSTALGIGMDELHGAIKGRKVRIDKAC